MNYFAHYYFDHKEANPYYNAGLVLPDFARSAAGNKHINTSLEHDFTLQPHFFHLNEGSKQHYATDGFFHNTPFFSHCTHFIEDLFVKHNFPKDGQRFWFLSHILFELILDRVLIQQHPQKLDDFYTALRQCSLKTVVDFLALSGKDGSDRFSKFWNGFLEAQYLQYYLIDEKLLYSINRVVTRAKQPELNEAQALAFIPVVHNAEKEIAAQLPTLEKEIEAFRLK